MKILYLNILNSNVMVKEQCNNVMLDIEAKSFHIIDYIIAFIRSANVYSFSDIEDISFKDLEVLVTVFSYYDFNEGVYYIDRSLVDYIHKRFGIFILDVLTKFEKFGVVYLNGRDLTITDKVNYFKAINNINTCDIISLCAV